MMQSNPQSEPLEVGLMSRSRSVSLSSDLQVSKGSALSPPPVDPIPAFIAASAASQIVGADLEQSGFISGDGEGAFVNSASLALLNGFLDYLLFNILAAAKSTQLSALRPAIADVLRPRLAKEVVSAADEELGEYMGGGEDEELAEFRGGQEPRGEFDLVWSWKLTRLRCMVYTRLGDLEEEEEDEFIAQEGLDESGGAPRRFSSHIGNITPAAAIFLTSIIEYLGEHALVLAGENARSRLQSSKLGGSQGNLTGANVRLAVEESDMEKLALNSTLGRLWRIWRKRVRGPTLSRTLSRESFSRRGIVNSRKSSIGTMDEMFSPNGSLERSVEEDEEQVDPASIALPMTQNDVKEIEVPGLGMEMDGEITTMQATVAQKVRPRSLMVSSSGLLTPTSSSAGSPRSLATVGEANFSRHSRSRSLPIQAQPANAASPVDEDGTNGGDVATPPEERPWLETMYENEESDTEAAAARKQLTHQPPQPRGTDYAASSLQSPTDQERPEDRTPKPPVQQVDSGDDLVQQRKDYRGEDVEVIEGHGTYEIPKLSQRPKRKTSKEVPQRDNRSTYTSESRDVPRSYRSDPPPRMQGVTPMPNPVPISTQENGGFLDDRSRSRSQPQNQSISPATLPTSHLRQSEGASLVSPPAADVADTVDGLLRSSGPASRHASSYYSDSIGGPQSTSDEGESISRSRTPSRAASQLGSIGGQLRHGQGDNSSNTERAAVQRLTGPSTSQTSSVSKSRRSESIGERRPQTSGSTTSTVSNKFKGLIGRHPAEGENPLPPRVRTPSDASRKSTTSEEISDNKSDLDSLIKSNETLHYTLTPRNVRDMEASPSPRWNTARTDTSELADFLKNTAPPGEVPSPRPRTNSGNPTSRMNGLRAHPTNEHSASNSTSVSVPPSTSPTSQRSKTYEARDAKIAAESTRDFADFIRSTGPPASLQSSSNAPNRSLRTHYRDASGSVVSNSRSDTPQSTSSRATARLKETESPRRTGQRLQARAAAVANQGNQTSDLIDFIREGPPQPTGHRIPRTVAPFRTTMDSDELLSLEIAQIPETATSNSIASTYDGSTQAESLRSSVNSRAPLLESSNRSNAPPGAPARKQRRVRDPYAIDSDDEDLDELLETPKPKPKPQREESLLDFLNSVPPPPTNDGPPVPFSINANAVPPKSSGGGPTASAMRMRFRRNTSVDKAPAPKPSMASMRSRRSNKSASIPISTPIVTPYVPPSTGASVTSPSRPYTNHAGGSGYATRVNQDRGGSSSTTYRPAGSVRPQRQTETSELADFLMNTAPPEPPVRTATSMSEERKDSSTLSRIFRRGKKVEA